MFGDVFEDRVAVRTLLAGATALLASGLDPRIWSPQLSSVQAAVRAQPGLESTILVNGLIGAIVLLVAGALGDLARARILIRGGLVVLLAASVLCLFTAGTPLFTAGRIASNAAAALVFPVALASVAVAYTGINRATAIGLAYAAYSVGQALMPVLLTLRPGFYAPGFLAEIVAASIALWFAWGHAFDLPRPTRAERPYVIGTVLWASGVVSLATGILWLGGGLNPIRIGMIVLGIVLGYGPLFGMAAIAPLFAALVVAGPIAGWLLARVSPRNLVGGGVVALGIGLLATAWILGPDTGYLGFIVPFLAIGAGFVIAAIAVAVAVLRSPAPPAEAEERAPRLEPAYREAA